jgi:glycerophosphoryl diester phosphodiesterase
MTQQKLRRQDSFDLQGHRGARALWPENTLAGFAHALKLGVTSFELDCAVSRDGVAVVSHDPRANPDHTRDERGRYLESAGPPICTLTRAELQRYDVGRIRPGSSYAAEFPRQQPIDGERIPSLAEVFGLCARLNATRVRFNIEAKLYPLQPELTLAPEPFVRALLGDIRRAGLVARASIQSFDWRVLRIVQELEPTLATGALTDQQGADDTVLAGQPGPSPWLAGLGIHDFGGSVPRLAKASGAAYWSPNYLDLVEGLVDEAHALGLLVIPWTVNDPADMRRIVDWGVDGMISDRPELLRDVLQSRGIAVPEPLPD